MHTLSCFVAASSCGKSRYLYAVSCVSHKESCFVTYRNHPHLTWYEAAFECMKLGGHLASFDTTNDGLDPSKLIPQECAWIGLVKKFFHWTIIQRMYMSQTLMMLLCLFDLLLLGWCHAIVRSLVTAKTEVRGTDSAILTESAEVVSLAACLQVRRSMAACSDSSVRHFRPVAHFLSYLVRTS